MAAQPDQSANGDECVICLEPLGPSSAGFCKLSCSHVFHVSCAEELRSHGISQVCPMCRAELPPGPEQVYEEGNRLFLTVDRHMERSDGSWGRLTTSQRRAMDKALEIKVMFKP